MPQELTYSDLLTSQFAPLRAPARWTDNAANIEAAVRGDGSALEDGAAFFVSPAGWGAGTTSSAIQCADSPASKGPQAWPQVFNRLNRKSPALGRHPLRLGVDHVLLLAGRGEDAYRGPWNAVTPNPILLVAETHEPNDFSGNAVGAERELGNAVLLTHEGYGHLNFENPSACVDQAIVAYLTELITTPKGTVCQSNQQPFDPNFVIGGG